MTEPNGAITQPTREQLEAGIKVCDNWIAAINRGTFQGQDAPSVAGVLAFLNDQKAVQLKQYEAMTPMPTFEKGGQATVPVKPGNA